MLVVLQLYHALPSGTIIAKSGDEEFKKMVILAVNEELMKEKAESKMLQSFVTYLVRKEASGPLLPILGKYEHIGLPLELDSTKVSVSLHPVSTMCNEDMPYMAGKGAHKESGVAHHVQT